MYIIIYKILCIIYNPQHVSHVIPHFRKDWGFPCQPGPRPRGTHRRRAEGSSGPSARPRALAGRRPLPVGGGLGEIRILLFSPFWILIGIILPAPLCEADIPEGVAMGGGGLRALNSSHRSVDDVESWDIGIVFVSGYKWYINVDQWFASDYGPSQPPPGPPGPSPPSEGSFSNPVIKQAIESILTIRKTKDPPPKKNHHAKVLFIPIILNEIL